MIVRDQWNGYAYRFGDNASERCIVSFDVSACDPSEQKPSQLRRVIGFSPEGHIGPSGMPSPPAMQRLRAIETELVAELTRAKVACWLVGKQVYRGMRELLFQVDDLAGFARAYAVIEAKLGGTKLVEHADWTFFNDKISPGERGYNHIANREVMTALAQAGSLMGELHQLDHTFVGPPAALRSIAEAIDPAFGEPRYLEKSMTISVQYPLDDQDLIDGLTMYLRRLAKEHGASYDGWGAAVVSGN